MAIKFKYKNKEYILEYNRKSVRMMEGQGFSLEELSAKPATMVPMLFYGALAKNHQGVKRALADEMLEQLSDRQELIGALVEMCAETIEALTSGAETEGNVKWERTT